MKHVVVRRESRPGGYWLDPRPYLELLPEIIDALPPGARAFAKNVEHYEFNSGQCIKDLRFSSMAVDDATRRVSVKFAPHPFKHATGLEITYTDVTSLSVDREGADGIGWLGTLLLDKVLPVDEGVSHEVKLSCGSIRVISSDLEARWQ